MRVPDRTEGGTNPHHEHDEGFILPFTVVKSCSQEVNDSGHRAPSLQAEEPEEILRSRTITLFTK